jgi:hypothetical protein
MAWRRVLSLKQPWAALLVSGIKTIEIRRWTTSFRGPVLIHAARVADSRPQGWKLLSAAITPLAQLRQGILGEAILFDCRWYDRPEAFAADQRQHGNDLSWWEPRGLAGFCFREMRLLPFVPLKGNVRLFQVEWPEPEAPRWPPGVEERVRKLLRREDA